MTRHRIFVAIAVSKNLQKEIINWEKKYCVKLPARRLAGKNLHITLIPPWYAEEKEISDINESLKDISGKTSPFILRFEKVSFGSDPRHPRLIWAEGRVPSELLKLKNRLESALKKQPEKRPFLLHLTLARFRPEDFAFFAVKTLDKKVKWEEAVESFVVMESHLSRAGADYEILSEIRLQ